MKRKAIKKREAEAASKMAKDEVTSEATIRVKSALDMFTLSH